MLHSYIEQFLHYCQVSNFPAKSLEAFKSRLNEFNQYLQPFSHESISAVTYQQLLTFVADYNSPSVHVKKNRVWALHQFYHFLKLNEIIDRNIAVRIPYPKIAKKVPQFLTMAELVLLFFALIHILIGATLFYQNLKARPIRYSINKKAGGRSIGSATMPYTGLLLLIFVIIHLINFHFIDKTDTTIFQIVADAFAKPVYISMYVAAMIVVAIHLSHGFWSAFQTIGANHPKYMPFIRGLSIVFSIVVGIGFGFIPIYIALIT